MYIQPNTTIKFLQNIPFDADYNDTVYFTSEDGVQGQYSYFNAKAKYTIQNNMYQRVNKNELKVSLPYTGIAYESTAEKLYDCNYMMFQNTNFGNKWFYAFVKTVEWINNETAKITYEIDEMQTWMFDYDLEQCFVEREHSARDKIGDNLVPENLDLGYEYVTSRTDELLFHYNSKPANISEAARGWCIGWLAIKKPNGQPPTLEIPDTGWTNSPIPSTVDIQYFYLGDTSLIIEDVPDWTDFQTQYSKYISSENNLQPDDVIVLFLCPAFLMPEIYSLTLGGYFTKTIPTPTHLGTFNNIYTPQNKKLLSYPYTQLVVSNQQGNTGSFKFEYFPLIRETDNWHYNINFGVDGIGINNPTLLCYPLNYSPAQSINGDAKGIDYSISTADFPQLAIVGDAFKAWWAQNKNSITTSQTLSVISGLFQFGAGAVMSETPFGPIMMGSGIASAAGAIARTNAKKADAKAMANTVSNLTNTGYAIAHMGECGFKFHTKTITAQQAKIIDDYFTMFGYACHEVKTPNRNVRPKWTYTQTVGCTIKARCPGDSQKKICQIYDKGIRFWNKNAEIGKYYNDNGTPINNSPVAG